MKSIIQIVLWVACVVLGYLIYKSVTGPIEFNNTKQERFSKVISSLKDIRNSQEAYKTVNKVYAGDFKSLISFVENGKYTITQQRDSSFTRFDKAFGIDMPKDTVLIDTLGFVSVKDSLFKTDSRYKNMMKVPGAAKGEEFTMKSSIIDKSGYRAPVFVAKVAKNVVLHDQPSDLLARENAHISVEEVNGSNIEVGSLTEVSTSGNWPHIYDKKEDN